MAKIDIFDGSDFTMASLTESINKLPFPPTRLGNMGLFSDRPIMTTDAHIEDKQGTLSLLAIKARGGMGDATTRDLRKTRNFAVPHVPVYHTLLASDIQNIRAFGSETELESAGEVTADVLQSIVDDIAVTQEFHRTGCIQGSIKDSDGTTEYLNLFTGFGVSETDITMDFADGVQDAEAFTSDVHRAMASALGATPYTGIVGICGNDWFDSMAANAQVRAAYDRFQDGEFLRRNKLGPDFVSSSNGFSFQDIFFFNYRGAIGGTSFIPTGVCRFVALGVPGLFIEALAPPDVLEFANTRGRRFYVSQERLKHGTGIEFRGQGNVLPLCTRPASLIKSTGSNFIS